MITNPVVSAFLGQSPRVQGCAGAGRRCRQRNPLDGYLVPASDERPIEQLIDLAVGQLEYAGLVATKELEDKLADGHPDYEIRLTEQGRAFLEHGGAFEYEDQEL